MSVELGSAWLSEDSKRVLVVNGMTAKGDGDVVVNYISWSNDGISCFTGGMCYTLFLQKNKKLLTEDVIEETLEKRFKDKANHEYQRGLKAGKYLVELESTEARQHHYDMGYNNALAHMASEEAENTLELKKQWYQEGFDGGFTDGYSKGYNTAIKGMRSDEALGEECENKFGTEGCCESHNPNKETEEAMQEVSDKVQKSIEDMKTFLKQFNEKDGEDGQLEKELALVEKYPHYYKDIRHLNIIDIYRFFDLFEVTDPCIQHSVKKLAVGGKRGAKDYEKDIKEAMDTLKRWEYMQEENKRGVDD